MSDLTNIPDAQLDERVAAVLAKLSTRSARFVMEHSAGATAVEAARRAGLSPKGGAPYKLLGQPRLVELMALLREQARRRAVVTLEGQILRIQHLGRGAEVTGDTNAALRAEDMINKLSNLYQPEIVSGGGSPVQIVVVTGLPQREPILALPPAASRAIVPVARIDVTPRAALESPRDAQPCPPRARALSQEETAPLTLDEVLFS